MENKDYNMPNNDYCAPEQDSADPYSRPVYETAEEYNQANRQNGYNQYNGNTYNNQQYDNQQYGYQQYGNQNYGYSQYGNFGGGMVDAAGNPLKNRFAVQLVFAIIEILLCCFSPVAMILGIIALVFAVQANTAFNAGLAADYKAKSKTSNILLIIGGVFAVISIIINIIFASVYMTQFESIFEEMQSIMEEDFQDEEVWGEEGGWNEDDWDAEGDWNESDEDIHEDYIGTNDVYLADGFEQFTYNGVAYSVPMPYEEFQKMGYTLEDGFEGYVLAPHTYEGIGIYDEEGYEMGIIRISNDTNNELALEDGIVDYIYLDNPASYITDGSVDHIDLTFGNGFDVYTTYEELEEWLGTPYYAYVDNSDGTEYANYEWEYDGDDKYQYISISYLDGVITDITFEQYDFVD